MKHSEVKPGDLFLHGGTVCLKSEYFNGSGACLSYIVGSGEVFWGGVKTSAELNDLAVIPISLQDQQFNLPELYEFGFREKRKSLGLSLRDVAEETGVSPSTISRIENGKPCEYDAVKYLNDFYNR